VRYSAVSQPDYFSEYRLGAIAGKGYIDGLSAGYGLLVNTDNRLRWQVRDHDTVCETSSDNALNDGRWRLAIGVCDRDDPLGLRLYIDGVRQNLIADPTVLNGVALYGSWAFAVGSRQGGSDGSWYWDLAGSVAMVCVWKRVLAEREIHDLQRDPFGLFVRTHTAAGVAALAQSFVSCAGAVHATTSASATLRVTRNLIGEIDGSASVGGALRVTGFVSLSGAVAGRSCVRAALTTAPRPASADILRVERPWWKEAILNGATRTAFQLGTSLTQGWFWVRSRGCTAVYRGSDITQVDLARILYVAEPDAQEIRLPEYLSHTPGSICCYLLRRFNACGRQDKTTTAATVLRIGSDGRQAQARPNAVVALNRERLNATSVRLAWFYCPLDQESVPAQFNIYRDGCDDPTAIIPYQGRRHYRYTSDPLTDGLHTFVVRAATCDGIEGPPSMLRVRQVVASAPEPPVLLAVGAI
jgi:hypothetical protein